MRLFRIMIIVGTSLLLPALLTDEIVGISCAKKGEKPGMLPMFFSRSDGMPYLCNLKTRKCSSALSQLDQDAGVDPSPGFRDVSEPENQNPLAYINANRNGNIYSFDIASLYMGAGSGSLMKGRRIVNLGNYTSKLQVQMFHTSGEPYNVYTDEVCSLRFRGRRLKWSSPNEFSIY